MNDYFKIFGRFYEGDYSSFILTGSEYRLNNEFCC